MFKDKKLQQKFDASWVSKKVVKGRYIDLLKFEECSWNIFCFVKKKKWTGFLEIHEPVYPRLVKSFFSVAEVDHNNFTLKATIKGTEILIS